MPMHVSRRTAAPIAALFLLVTMLAPGRALAQHGGHEMMVHDSASHDSTSHTTVHLMAQGIPLVTRAAPTVGAVARTEATLTQTALMAGATLYDGRIRGTVTLNGEGLTMRDGELNTGAYGEGFVDRRHPHTYLHELVATGVHTAGPFTLSASAGRGFAPFGTDDPMMRPLVKYPINHHLAQILERTFAAGAARLGPVVLEGATFAGDEPTSPSSLPRLARFGDSWSARATLHPAEWAEVQGSYARVASPEQPTGFGLDQRKRSASARLRSRDGARYLLAEWAATAEVDPARDAEAFSYQSALVEGAARAGPFGLALRLEQTDRPEEERLSNPFRTPRPASDLSIAGITRWRVATLNISAPALVRGALSGIPFVEVARLAPSARGAALIEPRVVYGESQLWMLTAGLRLRLGPAHGRMGRYGAADANDPPIGTMSQGAPVSHHH